MPLLCLNCSICIFLKVLSVSDDSFLRLWQIRLDKSPRVSFPAKATVDSQKHEREVTVNKEGEKWGKSNSVAPFSLKLLIRQFGDTDHQDSEVQDWTR